MTHNTTLPSSSFDYAYDGQTNTATLTWNQASRVLPDASYRITVPAGGVKDLANNPIAQPATFDFFVLAPDANHDRTVDLTDFTILAANFNHTGKTFAEGNFDYDPAGRVDLTDFTILAANFNRTMPPPTSPAVALRLSTPFAAAPVKAQDADLAITSRDDVQAV